METGLQNVPQGKIVNIEDQAMSISGLLGQVKLIQEVMEKVMKKDEHYGTIPGTKKPTLLKPGAEKLCLTFRLDPDYQIIREVRDKDFIAYTVKCNLTHIPTSQNIASGVGSCNSKETKYRYRFIDESTGVPVPKKYWDAKDAGDNKEMKRSLQIPNMEGEMRASKIDGQWVIAKSQRIENDNPWDLDNTIIKMACKRALVAATLNATAASDIFTQDLEDMPEEIIKTTSGKPEPEKIEEKPEPLTDAQLKDIRAKIDQKESLSSTEKTTFFNWIKDNKAETMTTKGKKVITKRGAEEIIKNLNALFTEYTGGIFDNKSSEISDVNAPI